MPETLCHICKQGVLPSEWRTDGEDTLDTACRTCGLYSVTRKVLRVIDQVVTERNAKSALLSFNVRRMQRGEGNAVKLTQELIDEFLKRDLPTAAEQANNFILWLGDKTAPGQVRAVKEMEDYAAVGAYLSDGLYYLIRNLKSVSILEERGGAVDACLSFAGWKRFEELKRGHSDSKKAFMAMRFGDGQLDAVFQTFKSAVSHAGFSLTRMDEKPEAGTIDNRIRVEIQTSRFIIADLTHDNLGAYWESGFAEGLGKPVFYSCSQAHFEEKKTHFDANHSYTVLWEPDRLQRAGDELTIAIRATLPDEAKMTDD